MKLHPTLLAKVLALTVVGAVSVTGLSHTSDAASGRYQMTPIENGFMRLDTETGAVSLCKNQSGKVACVPASEHSDQDTQELDALRQENKNLRAELNRLEQHFGLGPEKNGGPDKNGDQDKKSGPDGKPNDLAPPLPPSTAFKLPQKEDVDQMFNYIEGMLKKFRERIKRLEKEAEQEREL